MSRSNGLVVKSGTSISSTPSSVRSLRMSARAETGALMCSTQWTIVMTSNRPGTSWSGPVWNASHARNALDGSAISLVDLGAGQAPAGHRVGECAQQGAVAASDVEQPAGRLERRCGFEGGDQTARSRRRCAAERVEHALLFAPALVVDPIAGIDLVGFLAPGRRVRLLHQPATAAGGHQAALAPRLTIRGDLLQGREPLDQDESRRRRRHDKAARRRPGSRWVQPYSSLSEHRADFAVDDLDAVARHVIAQVSARGLVGRSPPAPMRWRAGIAPYQGTRPPNDRSSLRGRVRTYPRCPRDGRSEGRCLRPSLRTCACSSLLASTPCGS